MGKLATAVKDRNLYFVASFQEGGNLAQFDIKIMLAYLEAKAHLLHVEGLGIALVLLQLLRALVIEFTPVDNLRYRWFGVWRDFYQVQTLLTGNIEGFLLAK